MCSIKQLTIGKWNTLWCKPSTMNTGFKPGVPNGAFGVFSPPRSSRCISECQHTPSIMSTMTRFRSTSVQMSPTCAQCIRRCFRKELPRYKSEASSAKLTTCNFLPLSITKTSQLHFKDRKESDNLMRQEHCELA